MAEIRCPNCGQENPDFFDNCQFCQTSLKSDSKLHAGDAPSEMDTGELEPILPEWLQDARQQNRDSVEDNSVSPETKPSIQSIEPVDLLAGLSSQDDSDEDEVPDWLASINPVEDKRPSLTSSADEKEEPSDFFAQFSQIESSQDTSVEEPVQKEDTPFMGMEFQSSSQTDELSSWLSQTNNEENEPLAFGQGDSASADKSWMDNLGSPEPAASEPPVQKEPEDLSWLHNLESEAKKTGDLSSHQEDAGFDFSAPQPVSSDEDLSWLSNLGGTPAPASTVETSPSVPESSQDDLSWMDNLGGMSSSPADEPAPAQPGSSDEDLSWLSNLGETATPLPEEKTPPQQESSEDLSWLDTLGGTSTPTPEESTPAQAESSEDLNWLDNLGGTPIQPAKETASAQPESSQEDLSWLDNLGGTPTPATEDIVPSQTESSEELGWMNDLGQDLGNEESKPTLTPRGTAPLAENAGYDSTPDWLKSAMKGPSMPAPGDLSMDWFTDHDKSTSSDAAPDELQESFDAHADENSVAFPNEPASVSKGLDLPESDSFAVPATSSQDVDDMFNVDISNWGSEETDSIKEAPLLDSDAAGDGSLAPASLPSWVQAMRPVDSAIDATSTTDDREQEAEREGPLAGFHGIIPSAPIGSSLRPKAFSLKLRATDDQQAGAELIEQIIASETTVAPLSGSTVVASQRVLRWTLSALLVIVLGLVIGLGWQNFDIIAPGQVEVDQLSTIIESVPDNSPVLLVMDYEPAVAGELAAAAGPVLDQLAVSRHSNFTFLAMSPNGSAMVEHLLWYTKISVPVSDDPFDGGLGYQVGEQYFNAGFLPGGSAGVLGFIDDPVKMMPDVLSLATVGDFSNFEAVILLTDNAESGRVWVEQLEISKQGRPEIAFKPLIVISSGQAGPMLVPYALSGQVDVLINGLSDAAKYEFVNQSRPGLARTYWDAFGIGIIMAVLSIILGSIWNVFMGIRERRAEAEQE